MGLSLKKFIKYFDNMNELSIMEFPNGDDNGNVLFTGHAFDKGAKKKLRKLYKQGYKLDRNEDGVAVMLYPYRNEHGVSLCKVQINVKKGKTEQDNTKSSIENEKE